MSFNETVAPFTACGEVVEQSIDEITKAHALTQEASEILESIGGNADSFNETTIALVNAQKLMGILVADLVQFPNTINPYLGRVGAPSLGQLQSRLLDSVSIKQPEVLREASPDARENLQPSEKYFKSRVAEIDALLDAGHMPESLPGYIDKGSTYYVYLDEATNVIIKMPRVEPHFLLEYYNAAEETPRPPGVLARDFAEPLLRGKGIPGTEQLICFIDDGGEAGKGAIICEVAPGSMFHDIPFDEQAKIPDHHFDQLVETIEAMAQRRLVLDTCITNLLYDPEKGFTVIDYQTAEYRERKGLLQGSGTLSQVGIMVKEPRMFNLKDVSPVCRDKMMNALRRRFGVRKAARVKAIWNKEVYNATLPYHLRRS